MQTQYTKKQAPAWLKGHNLFVANFKAFKNPSEKRAREIRDFEVCLSHGEPQTFEEKKSLLSARIRAAKL